jgi:hypothetical protein
MLLTLQNYGDSTYIGALWVGNMSCDIKLLKHSGSYMYICITWCKTKKLYILAPILFTCFLPLSRRTFVIPLNNICLLYYNEHGLFSIKFSSPLFCIWLWCAMGYLI